MFSSCHRIIHMFRGYSQQPLRVAQYRGCRLELSRCNCTDELHYNNASWSGVRSGGTYPLRFRQKTVPVLLPASCGLWLKVMPSIKPCRRATRQSALARDRGTIDTVCSRGVFTRTDDAAMDGTCIPKNEVSRLRPH